MNVRTLTLATLTTLAALSVTLACRELRALANARTEMEALRARRASLERERMPGIPAMGRVRGVGVSVVEAALRRVTVGDATGQPTPPSGNASRGASTMPSDPVATDPRLQNLYLAAERAGMAGLYAPLFRELRLSLAQQATLENLLMWRREQQMDLADVIEAQRLVADDPSIRRLRERATASFRAAVTREFGAAVSYSVQEFERMLPAWQIVHQFAGAAAVTGEPVAPETAKQLAKVLAEASPDYQQGGTADPNTISWPVVLQAVLAILTPPQQRSFRNLAPSYPLPSVGDPTVTPARPGE